MVLWLASYPRSGNTLARMIIHAGSGLPTYSVHENGEWARHGGPIAKLIGHKKLPKLPEKLVGHEKLFIIKTHHGVVRTGKSPTIYVVRDGRDAIVSYAHYGVGGGKTCQDSLLDGLVRGKLGWGLWGDRVLEWKARKFPTAYVRYEDMLEAPYESVQRALDHLGIALELRPQPLETFGRLHEMDSEFFRKGKVGGWRREMPPELHELFWELHEGGMRAYGYTKN